MPSSPTRATRSSATPHRRTWAGSASSSAIASRPTSWRRWPSSSTGCRRTPWPTRPASLSGYSARGDVNRHRRSLGGAGGPGRLLVDDPAALTGIRRLHREHLNLETCVLEAGRGRLLGLSAHVRNDGETWIRPAGDRE